MNVGDRLEDAAAGLARALALSRRQPPIGPQEQAAVAVARVRLYQGLGQQAALLRGMLPGPIPRVRDVAAFRLPDPPQLSMMASELREATVRAAAAMPHRLPEVPASGPVGRALTDAADAVHAANELISAHFGGARQRPPTLEGVALSAGHGKDDNIALTARLVGAVVDLDVRLRLSRWLEPGEDAGVWRPLLLAVNADIRHTPDTALGVHAYRVALGGAGDRAPVRALEPVPLTDDPARWASVRSGREAIAAMDAARAWLLRHGDRITAGQVAAASRAALVMTHHIGHVLGHTTDVDGGQLVEVTLKVGKDWRAATMAAATLRSNVRARDDHSTLTVALGAVAGWLHGQLRSDGGWRPASEWAGSERQRAAWRRTVGQIAARLPDVAALMRTGLQHAQRSGNLLRVGDLRQTGRMLIQFPQWVRAEETHPQYGYLRGMLRRLGKGNNPLAVLAGVARPPGLKEAATAERMARSVPQSPWQLAAAGFPSPTDARTVRAGPGRADRPVEAARLARYQTPLSEPPRKGR
ncbi:hypothetical protein [Micromonospora sp. CPCC 206061]|uniref:hypothetical protein n=1 Tax=Micromonospora sp. CPCC 206061 TaxID=3122410 RepID=UPI002FF0D730